MKISAQSEILFKRLKIEVGEDPESKDAVFVTSGRVNFNECLIEATVNTLFYVLNGAHIVLGNDLLFKL